MTRIVHLSDLHFGKDREDLLEPLLASIAALSPDLVAISGDLTQRAREREYIAAGRFIDRITAPVLVVPGNHDVPVHRPFTRFLMPWRYYRKYIDANLTPIFEDDAALVVGVNTVDRFSWQTGRLSGRRISRTCAALAEAPRHKARILVAHHPLNHPTETHKRPIPGAEKALAQFLECGTDLILSGHLHTWHVGTFAEGERGGAAVQLHAGTSLSSRLRGEPNDFNVIDIKPNYFDIRRQSHHEGEKGFKTTETRRFDRVSDTISLSAELPIS